MASPRYQPPPSAPAAASSSLMSATEDQLLQMPQANLSLAFTRSVMKGGGGAPRSSTVAALSSWPREQHQVQQEEDLGGTSAAAAAAPGGEGRRASASQAVYGSPQAFGASSPRSARGGLGPSSSSAAAAASALDAASHASALVAMMTPRSSRQKAWAYAEGIEKPPSHALPLATSSSSSSPRPATVGPRMMGSGAAGGDFLGPPARSGASFGFLPGGAASPRGHPASSPYHLIPAQGHGGGAGGPLSVDSLRSPRTASNVAATPFSGAERGGKTTIRDSSPPSQARASGGRPGVDRGGRRGSSPAVPPLLKIPMLQLSKIRLEE